MRTAKATQFVIVMLTVTFYLYFGSFTDDFAKYEVIIFRQF